MNADRIGYSKLAHLLEPEENSGRIRLRPEDWTSLGIPFHRPVIVTVIQGGM